LDATDAFGVACLEEALEIRQLGYTQPITLIEGVFSEDEMKSIEQKLECLYSSHEQVEWLIQNKEAYNALGLKGLGKTK
jgi:alanine racemase